MNIPRYDFTHFGPCYPKTEIDGDWCRYEDVEKFLGVLNYEQVYEDIRNIIFAAERVIKSEEQ